jgi:hypothetical protein
MKMPLLRKLSIREPAENSSARRARFGLIDNPLSWFSYGDARNLASHTYDEDKTETVYETAIDFLEDAKDILKRLQEHND